jgi:hypothetical protein
MGGSDGGMGGSTVYQPPPSDRRFITLRKCYLTSIEFDQFSVTCEGQEDCGGAGRPPPGFVPHAARHAAGAGEVARYLAQAAELEAASVEAFARLSRELALHGAPAELVAAARAAMVEEQAHAHAVGRLARRYGYEPRPVEVRPLPLRGLLEMLLDNADVGCVGEAYAAAEAAHAAAHAQDRQAAAAWRRIAVEEAAHAALSFAIDDWARPQLSAAAAAKLDARRAQAVARLASNHTQPGAAVRMQLGLPDRSARAALVATLDQQLWQLAA